MSHEIGTETPPETLAQFRAAFEYVAQYFAEQKTKRRGRRTPRQAARWQQIAAEVRRNPLPPREPEFVGSLEVDGRAIQAADGVFIVPETGMYEIILGAENG